MIKINISICVCIWSLSLLPDQSSKNPWNFLSDKECLCYANGVTLGRPWIPSGWRMVTRKANCVIRGFGPTQLVGRGERPEVEFNHRANDWLNHLCLCNETPVKTLGTETPWRFLVDKHIDVLGVMYPVSRRRERGSSAFYPITWLCPMHLSIWLLLTCNLYNETVVISIVPSASSVSCSIKLPNLKGLWEALKFFASQREVRVAWRHPNLRLTSEVEAV